MSSKQPGNEVSLNPVYLSARSAIVTPELAIPVTIYSMKKWLPRLGPERWGLVQLLRGLCFNISRRPDGTKRVTTSWKTLGELLQVHEETIASWLKHEPIPDDKPWRQIIPADDYAEYLSLFVPRLRYAYESRNGKTRRVGFILEVLMEDPVAPEDEMKLAHQVELLSYEQRKLGLESQPTSLEVNTEQTNLPSLSDTPIKEVTSSSLDLPTHRHPTQERFTYNDVNPDNDDLQTPVKQDYVNSLVDVSSETVDLLYGKSETVGKNINKLNSLINKLKHLKHQKRNYLQILEPVVVLTEELLDDHHSTAMLYKVLQILFPDHTDIFVLAVGVALEAATVESSINKGALFVNELRQQTEKVGIDLGFKSAERRDSVQANSAVSLSKVSQSVSPPELTSSLEEAIWSETLNQLKGQMLKGAFDSVMQGTHLVGLEGDIYVIQVATPLAKDWLENRLRQVIERALGSVIGTSRKIKVEFRL